MMKKAKRERLQKAGWKVSGPQEFLGLSDDELALIEMKLALARSLKQRRLANNLTQDELARQLGSSQSRVAKMEAADATVSMELLVRSLLLLGATRQEVGRIIGRKHKAPAAQCNCSWDEPGRSVGKAYDLSLVVFARVCQHGNQGISI